MKTTVFRNLWYRLRQARSSSTASRCCSPDPHLVIAFSLCYIFLMKAQKLLFLILLFFSGICPSIQAASTLATNSKAEIPTILELRVSEASQSELKFGNIQPSALQPTEVGPMQVILRVNSNINEKYQVTQALAGPLENEKQATIDNKFLKFKTSSENKEAKPVSALTEMAAGTQTIYVSDEKGLSDTINAEYYLTVPVDQDPGDYTTAITYTVSSI